MRKYIILFLLCGFFGNAQYNLFARQNFNYKTTSITTNTEIGGVASTISTPALLATKLGIDVSRITNFSIVGSDVKCKIMGSYVIPNNCFISDASIRYYNDYDKLVNEIRSLSFAGCENLTTLDLDGVTLLTSTYHFNLTPKLVEIVLPNLVSITDETHFISATPTPKKYIYLPKLTTIGSPSINGNCFQGQAVGTKIYVHPSMSTCNSGNPDADLVAATNAGMLVKYITNSIAPSVATISNMVVYNTSIQLIDLFNNTNNIDHFEISINGGDLVRIDVNDFIPNLIKNTNYSIDITVVDVNYNKSPKTTINISTSNVDAQVERYGLVAYYKGETLNDNFGTNNLTNTGITVNSLGKVSKAFLSTSTGQKLSTITFKPITGPFSINIWCNPTSNPIGAGFPQIIGLGGYNADTGFSIWINSSRQVSWRINQSYDHYSSLTVLPLNTWTMLTIVYNGVSIKRYINGVEKTSESFNLNPKITNIMQLFARPEADGYFIGSLAEPSIYKIPLTQTQIDVLYNSGNGTTL